MAIDPNYQALLHARERMPYERAADAEHLVWHHASTSARQDRLTYAFQKTIVPSTTLPNRL